MWIEPADVVAVYPDASDITEGLIAHVQHLAEIFIGEQDEPTDRLKAAMVQITYRAHRAVTEQDPNVVQESLGSYAYTLAGFGFTDREKKLLKSAVGKSGLWVQPTTRGPVETPSSLRSGLEDDLGGIA